AAQRDRTGGGGLGHARPLPFLIARLTTGSVYGLAGMGLVLGYKTSGIFNFAHGAIAAGAAYLFYFLHVEQGWAWPPAAVVCVLVAGPLFGLALERCPRPARSSAPSASCSPSRARSTSSTARACAARRSSCPARRSRSPGPSSSTRSSSSC